MSENDIRNDRDRGRFVTTVEGREAVLDYHLDGDQLHLDHTGVPSELEGRGIGSALARHALDSARERGLDVWPNCRFVASYIQRHPEYLDVVDPAFPDRASLENG